MSSFFHYTMAELYEKVDRVVLVLVGAPRGISQFSWKRHFVDFYKNVKYTHKTRELLDNPPKFDIIVVQNEYDTPDRYQEGEDPKLAGLDARPYALSEHREINHAVISDIYENNKFPLNKTKWEQFHKDAWHWADSVNFVYCNTDVYRDEAIEKFKRSYTYTQWQNQFIHFCEAYKQCPDIFDKCTENTMVFRKRMDMAADDRASFWVIAQQFFSLLWSDKTAERQHTVHHQGFELSPIVGAPNINIIRGHVNCGDYMHIFDGPGARLFAKEYWDWSTSSMRRIFCRGHLYPGEDASEWSIPEMRIPEFCLEKGYTFRNINLVGWMLFSFSNPPLMDQWRYYWYDDWTPEIVEEIRRRTQSL